MDSGTLDSDRQDQAFGLVGCPGLLSLQLHSKRRCLTSSKTLESGNVTPVSVVLFMELRNLPGTAPKYSSRNPGQIGPSTGRKHPPPIRVHYRSHGPGRRRWRMPPDYALQAQAFEKYDRSGHRDVVHFTVISGAFLGLCTLGRTWSSRYPSTFTKQLRYPPHPQ